MVTHGFLYIYIICISIVIIRGDVCCLQGVVEYLFIVVTPLVQKIIIISKNVDVILLQSIHYLSYYLCISVTYFARRKNCSYVLMSYMHMQQNFRTRSSFMVSWIKCNILCRINYTISCKLCNQFSK